MMSNKRWRTALLTVAFVHVVAAVGMARQPAVYELRPVRTAAAHMWQSSTRTIWDGVYSKDQAARGEQAYRRSCGHCHRDNLTGGDAPALVGPVFFDRWRDMTLADMFFTIAGSMPRDSPSSLPVQVYLDIVGFLLRANGVPDGASELPADEEKLEEIRFTEKPTP